METVAEIHAAKSWINVARCAEADCLQETHRRIKRHRFVGEYGPSQERADNRLTVEVGRNHDKVVIADGAGLVLLNDDEAHVVGKVVLTCHLDTSDKLQQEVIVLVVGLDLGLDSLVESLGLDSVERGQVVGGHLEVRSTTNDRDWSHRVIP